MKNLLNLIAFIGIIAVSMTTSYYLGYYVAERNAQQNAWQKAQRDAGTKLLTVFDVQRLSGMPYDEIDGICGPLTIKAWDEALCRQYAGRYDYLYGD